MRRIYKDPSFKNPFKSAQSVSSVFQSCLVCCQNFKKIFMHTTTASTANLSEILTWVQAFVETELYPLEAEARGKSWNQILPQLEEKRRKVKELGLWTPQIPKAWGGLGLSVWEFGQVSAVLGQSPYGHYVFNCQAPDAGNMEILIEFGTATQQERFLKPLLAGEIRSCFAMTEPEHAGSNPVFMSTTAEKSGGDYVIDGHKWFTSSADGAAFAIVMAMTAPEHENKYQRASQIIVPLDNQGFKLVRNIPVMGEAGEGWASHGEVRFEKCRVPQEFLLGGEGAGFAIAQTRLGPGRIHHCMRWNGICERAFDLMCRYAVSRELSPGVPLASKQTIQNWIAESRAEINAARLMVLDAAQKIDEHGQYGARVEISVIKFFCANVLQNVLDRAIQVHGALGITEDTLLSFWYRHERGARIYDGADEVHKSRVAREILKGYGAGKLRN
jgi:acyl-CoA dehydrogenase